MLDTRLSTDTTERTTLYQHEIENFDSGHHETPLEDHELYQYGILNKWKSIWAMFCLSIITIPTSEESIMRECLFSNAYWSIARHVHCLSIK